MTRIAERDDRQAIMELISRYFAAIDDKRLDRSNVAAAFSHDAQIVRPNGTTLVGRDAIFDGHSESFARFRGTHHVTSDYVIDVVGDEAHIRANMTAMHLWKVEEGDTHSLQSHFIAGGVLQAVAFRTVAGWRLRQLSNRVCWRTGDGMVRMATSRQ